jgi:3'-phosphoadenosine 5'-phosphosulfate sulfotransferase (PAPS reductase)/FAD synthetase
MPFQIDGPAVISFSGGRTSGYMLRRILDIGLKPDVRVLFANTGKERPETLDFVHECEMRWNVPIHWLEYDEGGEYGCQTWTYRQVNYRTAARRGEPFEALIKKRGLPNPVFRFCTQELKIRPMRDYMRAQGYEHWTNVIGIRADEPDRVARRRQPTKERWDIGMPLADANVIEQDVMEFWAEQPFDLRLRPDEGNCDLCFLKSPLKRSRIARERPDLLVWWVNQEARVGSTFRRDVPSYAELLQQGDLLSPLGDLTECYCHD